MCYRITTFMHHTKVDVPYRHIHITILLVFIRDGHTMVPMVKVIVLMVYHSIYNMVSLCKWNCIPIYAVAMQHLTSYYNSLLLVFSSIISHYSQNTHNQRMVDVPNMAEKRSMALAWLRLLGTSVLAPRRSTSNPLGVQGQPQIGIEHRI